MPKPDIDATDLKILANIQENCRLTNVELAEKVNLSPSPCLRRVRNLEADGVIKGYMALVDQTRSICRSVFLSR